MRKTRNLPIDKKRFKEVLDRMGLRQVDVDEILGLKRLTITKVMHIRPVVDKIVMPVSNGCRLMSVKANDADGIIKTEVPKPEPRPLISVQVDADVLADAVKEGIKQFWQECKNDILKELEDVIFTGNYDARRKYTSQDLTYDLHKCWNTDKGYADLPEVQATLHRKR